jgi:hypothetical protein
MHKPTGLLLPLAISLASFPACSTTEQRAEASQSAAPVEVRATAIPAAAPAPEVTTAGAIPAKVATNNPATLVDRYTVMAGDTLGGIAARQDVYGDARLWPLLYRANVSQIGPDGLIFPNQVLTVDRKYTQEDVRAITGRAKAANAPIAAIAAKPAVEPQAVATATTPASTVSSAPAAPAEPAAKDTPAASVKSEVPPSAQFAQGKSAAPPAGQAQQGAQTASVKASDYLSGARAAFAAGDTPWAIYYYSIYLDQRNNDAGAWGELGNVHYLDGNFPEAAKAYFNAANLLIDRGQTARAMQLIPAIEEGDPRLSEAIQLRLTTVKR